MAAQILSFFERAPRAPRDWSQQELAEFYRVEHALLQAGVQLDTDRGLSDEGDPWFIFCRADSGEVFVHFALIDGSFVADGAAFEQPQWGSDFASLVRELIARYPLPRSDAKARSNIFLHPAALLTALVGAAYFHSNEAKAAEHHDPAKVETKRTSLIVVSAPVAPTKAATTMRAPEDSSADQAAAVILSAVLSLRDDLIANTTVLSVTSVPSGVADVRTHDFAAAASALVLPTPNHDAVATAAALEAHQASNAIVVQAVSIVPAGEAPHGLAIAAVAEHRDPIMVPPPAVPDLVLGRIVPVDNDKPLFIAHITPMTAVVQTEALAAAAAAAAADGLGNLLNKGLPQVDSLPGRLVDLINRGEHHSGTATAPPATSVGAAPTAPVDAGGDAGPNLPILTGHDPAIDAAIAQFLLSVAHLDVISQGNQLVLIDHGIFGLSQGDQNLASITYTFDDGSSVSLVGTAMEISHTHGV